MPASKPKTVWPPPASAAVRALPPYWRGKPREVILFDTDFGAGLSPPLFLSLRTLLSHHCERSVAISRSPRLLRLAEASLAKTKDSVIANPSFLSLRAKPGTLPLPKIASAGRTQPRKDMKGLHSEPLSCFLTTHDLLE